MSATSREVIGYTAETIRIAATLAVNSDARMRVVSLIQQMGEPTVYSGQRFDQSQELAMLLNQLDVERFPNDSMSATRQFDGMALCMSVRNAKRILR